MNAQIKLQTLIVTSDKHIQVFIVGGYVRDRILGRPCKDHDFVVVGADVDDMLKCGFSQVGADFPVFLAENGDEFALARTERKSGSGHKGFDTETKDVTLVEDLIRRDFTCNAMAREVLGFNTEGHAHLDDRIIDPFGGQTHLKESRLVHVGEAFAEDPLRVLRGARFAARYNFDIDIPTLMVMKDIVDSGAMETLTPERVWQEVNGAMSERFPHRFWDILSIIGGLDVMFPLIDTDILQQTAARATEAGTSDDGMLIRFAILTHTMGPWMSDKFFEKMKAPHDVQRVAKTVTAMCGLAGEFGSMTGKRAMKIFSDIGAFRRIDEFYDVIVPALVIIGLRSWAMELERMLRVTQEISFASLTEDEVATLKGPAIKARLDELKVDHIEQLRSTGFLSIHAPKYNYNNEN